MGLQLALLELTMYSKYKQTSMSDWYVGGLPIKSGILSLLKHACGEATGCHVDWEEVGSCHMRGESQGMYIMYASTKFE